MDFILKSKLNRFKKYIIKNKILFFIFFLSTLFFIIQHYFSLSWDFKAYLINAEYLFYGGDYFEVYRAPLISLFLGIFLIFGNLAGYIYIIFVSVLFLISAIKLSDALYEKYFFKYKLKKETIRFLFYLFSLNPFLLYYGLLQGTELLDLAFFQFFLAFFILNKNSGHYLGLAILSRYNFMIFLPLLLINKNYKKILKNIGLALIIIIPWLFFNYFQWGNFLTSIIDSYYLNVLSRADMIEAFNVFSLLKVIGYFVPFFIIGGYFSIKNIFTKKFSEYKYELLFLAIFMIFIYDIYSIPFKVTRYMFNLVLPVAFFSLIGTIILIKRFRKLEKPIYAILLTALIISIIFLTFSFYQERNEEDIFYEAGKTIESLGLEDCKILSPHWVHVNYYTGNVFYLGSSLDEVIENNKIALIFKNHKTIDDTFEPKEIDDYPSIFESEEFVLIAKGNLTTQNCIKNHKKDNAMLKNPCDLISEKFKIIKIDSFVKKICLKFNKK